MLQGSLVFSTYFASMRVFSIVFIQRKGYPDDFNQKDATKIERDEAIIRLWEYTQKLAEKKKKAWINLGEFLIGAILLIFCFQYLQQHPAEKVALFSGFEVITQKVRVLFANKSEDLQEKYDLQRTYTEVVALAKEAGCLEPTQIQEIENRLAALESLNAADYESQKSAFVTYLKKQYLMIKKQCQQ